MTFYRDLSEFRYTSHPDVYGALNVGWLSLFRYCPIGPTTPEFRLKLFELCATPQLSACGYHRCLLGLCKLNLHLFGSRASLGDYDVTLGSGIIIVRGAVHTYVAPNLIYHYVTQHWYRPPKPFIDAVLNSAAVPPLRRNVNRPTALEADGR